MANTLTGLITDLYAGLDTVSRELVGYIPAARRDTTAERAAVNQQVKFPIVGDMAAADVTPASTSPATANQTIGNDYITISKSRGVRFTWNGEEQKGLNNASMPIYSPIFRDQVAQAIRTLTNEIELDLHNEVYTSASRAYGTAGTPPFGTAGDFTDFSNIIKILNDNGAGAAERHLVLSSAAAANLRGKQSTLFKVNEAGSADMLRNGALGVVQGLMLHESYPIGVHTKGTGAGYLVNNVSGIAVGGTTIAADTGTGTILAGDIVTFAADTANKYVVNSALAGGEFAIGKPGSRILIPNDNAITVGNSYTPNMVFTKGAVGLATRLPAMPTTGDGADDQMLITDPISGLTFEVLVYKQTRQVTFEVAIAWGVKAIKPEHIVTLIG